MNKYNYLFRVFTSLRRGSGTTAAIRIHRLEALDGSHIGPSEWYKNGTLPGSVFETEIKSDLNLNMNRLKQLEIGHDGVGNVGVGWLLEGLFVIKDKDEANRVWFPCNKWLGESDSQDDEESGPNSQILLPLVKNQSVPITNATTNAKLANVNVGVAAIPSYCKVKKGQKAKVGINFGYAGEDAYYVDDSKLHFGVADGVSQWMDEGVDVGEFSKALMRGAQVNQGSLESAYEYTKKLVGSSTICTVRVDLEKKTAQCLVIGDAQVRLIRKSKIIERSFEQEHQFGIPFQLTRNLDLTPGRDLPQHALKYEWKLEKEDVIVLGTDGVFDNLFDEQILAAVQNNFASPSNIAKEIINSVWMISQTKFGHTPYSKGASEAFDLVFSGGKQDDATVLVAKVT